MFGVFERAHLNLVMLLNICYVIYRFTVTLKTVALLCWSSGLCAGVSCMLVYLVYKPIALVVHWSSGMLCSIIYWTASVVVCGNAASAQLTVRSS